MIGWLFGRRAPRIPLPPTGVKTAGRLTRTAAWQQLERAYGKGAVRGDLHDLRYSVIDRKTIPDLARWLGNVHAHLDHAGFGYEESRSDCDDIAAMAMAVRRLLPFRYTPLAVRQSVQRLPGSLHMDVAFFTDRGWVAIEPQSGDWWNLPLYPNKVRWVFVQ